MNHIRAFLSGAASLFSALTPRGYPVDGGFVQDRRQLRADWARTGESLGAALKADADRRNRVQPANSR